jgi:hypothetical protein
MAGGSLGPDKITVPTSTTDPSSNAKGDMYFDTANDQLKISVDNAGTFQAIVRASTPGTSENPATDAQQLVDAGITTNGWYWFNTGTTYQTHVVFDVDSSNGAWVLACKLSGAGETWACNDQNGCGGNWTNTTLISSTNYNITDRGNFKYQSMLEYSGTDLMAYDTENGYHFWWCNGCMTDETLGGTGGFIGTRSANPGGSSCNYEWTMSGISTTVDTPFCYGSNTDCSANANLGLFCSDEEAWATRDFTLITVPNGNYFTYNYGGKPGLSSDRFDGGHGGGTHVDVDNDGLGGGTEGQQDSRAWVGTVGLYVRN